MSDSHNAKWEKYLNRLNDIIDENDSAILIDTKVDEISNEHEKTHTCTYQLCEFTYTLSEDSSGWSTPTRSPGNASEHQIKQFYRRSGRNQTTTHEIPGTRVDYTCGECRGSGEVICSDCNGRKYDTCDLCNGSGKERCIVTQNVGDCSYCGGDGKIYCHCGSGRETCNSCKGEGGGQVWAVAKVTERNWNISYYVRTQTAGLDVFNKNNLFKSMLMMNKYPCNTKTSGFDAEENKLLNQAESDVLRDSSYRQELVVSKSYSVEKVDVPVAKAHIGNEVLNVPLTSSYNCLIPPKSLASVPHKIIDQKEASNWKAYREAVSIYNSQSYMIKHLAKKEGNHSLLKSAFTEKTELIKREVSERKIQREKEENESAKTRSFAKYPAMAMLIFGALFGTSWIYTSQKESKIAAIEKFKQDKIDAAEKIRKEEIAKAAAARKVQEQRIAEENRKAELAQKAAEKAHKDWINDKTNTLNNGSPEERLLAAEELLPHSKDISYNDRRVMLEAAAVGQLNSKMIAEISNNLKWGHFKNNKLDATFFSGLAFKITGSDKLVTINEPIFRRMALKKVTSLRKNNYKEIIKLRQPFEDKKKAGSFKDDFYFKNLAWNIYRKKGYKESELNFEVLEKKLVKLKRSPASKRKSPAWFLKIKVTSNDGLSEIKEMNAFGSKINIIK